MWVWGTAATAAEPARDPFMATRTGWETPNSPWVEDLVGSEASTCIWVVSYCKEVLERELIRGTWGNHTALLESGSRKSVGFR